MIFDIFSYYTLVHCSRERVVFNLIIIIFPRAPPIFESPNGVAVQVVVTAGGIATAR